MRITLAISSLEAGGTQRVLARMARHWTRKGWEVTVVTLSGTGSDFYALEAGVRRIALAVEGKSAGLAHSVVGNLGRLFRLRSALRRSRPDAVISFGDTMNVLTLLASAFLRVPVVISERVDPRRHPIGRPWEFLRRGAYRHASALVVQTLRTLEWAAAAAGRKRAVVIPNPVESDDRPAPRTGPEFPRPFLLAMGRLVPQKGFHLLLPAFEKVASKFPDWSLVILGEGAERATLEALARSLRIEKRIHLPGLHSRPAEVLQQASLFVLPSLYEGFPNALLEAMASGLPSISFACPSGPDEIIRDGVDGILITPKDTLALADALQNLMEHPEMRERLGSQARGVVERFSMARIMGEWERLLSRLRP